VPSLRLCRGDAKKPREDILTAAPSPNLIGHSQRLAANGIVFALDRDIGDLPFVTFQDSQQSLVTAIDVVADLKLTFLVNKGGLVGQSGSPSASEPSPLIDAGTVDTRVALIGTVRNKDRVKVTPR
jgi:hypothetical protein